MAVREAALPENCSRTIYMCDDGKDPLKRDWVDSLGPDVIYVSGGSLMGPYSRVQMPCRIPGANRHSMCDMLVPSLHCRCS